jgi:antitoxin (DNA-binding transcriptional repressor) of toxin-antitoxin stability system
MVHDEPQRRHFQSSRVEVITIQELVERTAEVIGRLVRQGKTGIVKEHGRYVVAIEPLQGEVSIGSVLQQMQATGELNPPPKEEDA